MSSKTSRPVCLVVLTCGLPAVGKTTLVSNLFHHLPASEMPFHVHHIELDSIYLDLIQSRATTSSSSCGDDGHTDEFNINAWKESRRIAVSKVEDILRSKEKATVVFVDDNMFYRSMRLQYARLSASFSAAFAQIHITLPDQDTAIQAAAIRK